MNKVDKIIKALSEYGILYDANAYGLPTGYDESMDNMRDIVADILDESEDCFKYQYLVAYNSSDAPACTYSTIVNLEKENDICNMIVKIMDQVDYKVTTINILNFILLSKS